MKFLLDENLHPNVALILSVLRRELGDEFVHILSLTDQGAADDSIPQLCADNGCRSLITVNYKDFGAKKTLYEALIAAGIHVVVVRPGRLRWSQDQQVSLLSGKVAAFAHETGIAEAKGQCSLIRVTPSGVITRTLEELVSEIG